MNAFVSLVFLWRRLLWRQRCIVFVSVVCAAYLGVLYRFSAWLPVQLQIDQPLGLMVAVAMVLASALGAIYITAITGGMSVPLQGRPRQTVHVLLPLTNCDAMGDGLLQAAGFLAGSEAYPMLDVAFHDHMNNANAAVRKLEQLMEDWRLKDGPLWVVCSMSDVAQDVANCAKGKLREKRSLRGNFALFLTMCGAPSTPHDPQNAIFRYSIEGEVEVKKMRDHLNALHGSNAASRVVLLPLDSTYAKQSLATLASQLVMDGQPFSTVPFTRDGKVFDGTYTSQFAVRETDTTEMIAVVFGYDLAMFSTFDALYDAGFRGVVLASTTLSVPDWRQYLKTRPFWKDGSLKFFSLDYSGGTDDPRMNKYRAALDRWNFETLTNSEKLYGELAGKGAQEQFNEVEKQVYSSIEPNFISALCFDIMRIFAACASEGMSVYSENTGLVQRLESEPGPFAGFKSTKSGFTPNRELIVRAV